MNPRPGISPARTTTLGCRSVVPAGHAGCEGALSYRAPSPYGESLPFGIKGSTSVFLTPQITIHYSLITTHWSFTFSAKERDPETGLSYFGSRYYSSDLSIWLSVDPMAAKYPSLSPYVYCADNPVKLVDPNGEEIGDYFSMSGRYLGTDGKNDDKIYFVSNMADKRKIRQNDKAGLTTAVSTVNVKITTTKCALWAAEDVYNRTVKNGGFCEEASLVFPDGNIDDFKPGKDVRYTPNDMDAHVNLPKGYERDGTGILIHSHSLGEWELSDSYNHAWPVTSKLDADDLSESQKHAGFIIVGKTTPTDVFGFRRSMAYFFESDTYKGRVSLRAIRRVNKYYE